MPLRVFLRLGYAAVVAAQLTSCADCETISDCEDACDDAYPDDPQRLVGCYQQCELQDYDCEATADAAAPKTTGAAATRSP